MHQMHTTLTAGPEQLYRICTVVIKQRQLLFISMRLIQINALFVNSSFNMKISIYSVCYLDHHNWSLYSMDE